MKMAVYSALFGGLVLGQSAYAHDVLTECERDCFDAQANCYEDFVNPIGANMCSQEEAICQVRCQDPDGMHHPSNGIQSSFGPIDLL